jgi:hypothetical protein
MWPLIRGLWDVHRGRKAAVTVIAPLVATSRHRMDGIPQQVWLDPYIVGFMMMLITLAAQRAVNISDSQTLGAVQIEAWAEITEQTLCPIGEETLHLSASEHKAFEYGCRNAIAFDLALYGTSISGVADSVMHRSDAGPALNSADMPQGSQSREHVLALWQHYFETHVHADTTAAT